MQYLSIYLNGLTIPKLSPWACQARNRSNSRAYASKFRFENNLCILLFLIERLF